MLNTVTTEPLEAREVVLPVGSFRASTRQKNAALAFIALEPENIVSVDICRCCLGLGLTVSQDSFVTLNIIPMMEADVYPVFRITS